MNLVNNHNVAMLTLYIYIYITTSYLFALYLLVLLKVIPRETNLFRKKQNGHLCLSNIIYSRVGCTVGR